MTDEHDQAEGEFGNGILPSWFQDECLKPEANESTTTGEQTTGEQQTQQASDLATADDQAHEDQEAWLKIGQPSPSGKGDSSPSSLRIDTDTDRKADETDDPAQSPAPSRTNSWVNELDHLEPNSPISRRASWIGEFDHLRSFQTKKKSETSDGESDSDSDFYSDSDSDPAAIDDDSPSRLEWLRQRALEGKKGNAGLDRMMCMVGLEPIKAMFLSMKAAVEASARRGETPHSELIQLEVTGGPGTGTTWHFPFLPWASGERGD